MSSFSGATSTDTKQQIIASLFSKRSPEGPLEETYIAHLKIWEDVPEGQHVANGITVGDDGRKARYLMLAVTRLGKVVLHKAKRNTNLSFSKGKTWNLEDLRQVEVIEPQAYALTMTTRTYVWQTEKPRDQTVFLSTMLKVYRKYTQGKLPVMININIDEPGFDPGSVSPPIMSTSPPPVHAPPMRDRQGSNGSFSSAGQGGYPNPGPRNGLPPPLPIGNSNGNGHGNGAGSGEYSRSPLSRGYIDSAGPAPPSAMSSAYSPFPPQQNNVPYQMNSPYQQQQQIPPPGPPPAPAPAPAQRRPSETHRAPPMQHPASGAPVSLASSTTTLPKSASERSLGSASGGPRDPRDVQTPSPAVGRKASQSQLRETTSDRPMQGRQPPEPQGRTATPIQNPPSRPSTDDLQDQRSRTPTQSERRPGLSTSRSREKIRSQYQPSDPPPAVPPAPPQFNFTHPSPKATPVVTPSGVETPSDQRTLSRRVSFNPPQQSIPYSRDVLLRGASFSQGEALVDGMDDGLAFEDETMANVEEMLDGFDWSLEGSGQKQQSTTEAVEARLMDELNALDAANIHAFLETDDRISSVLKGIDDAVGELNEMDSHLASYKMQLNGVTEDIAYIESLNRGLQVQTSNQKALLSELEVLLTNMQVDTDALKALTQGSLETDKGIEGLEFALAALYRALLSSRDTEHGDMAATMQHVREYETHNRQFCTRLIDYLLIMFGFQADIAIQNASKQAASGVIPPHTQLEDKLGKYCGLILYMKEMDEERYQKLCGNYFSSASDLHGKEVKDCFMSLINKVRRPADDDKDDGTFAGAAVSGPAKQGAISRSKTLIGLRGTDKKEKRTDGEMTASEAFERGLQQVSAQITREEAFIADFLQISDAVITYADYMDLDVYFRRQASRVLAKGMSPATLKLRRSALDLIFGFLTGELKDWVDGALQREPLQIFGIAATCDRFCTDAAARNSFFFLNLMQKQQARMAMLADQFVAEQVRLIEAQKTNPKRKKGVAFFVRHLPSFAAQIEQQLVDCDDLPVREAANDALARITSATLETVQHIAKTDRSDAGEEKGQLNFHIITIENMHHLVQDAAKYDLPVLDDCVRLARDMYDEQMVLYIKALLRKSFSKPMDFFGAVQRQLENSTPQDISSASGFNKSALKRATKDVSTQKDLRKAVEALAKRVEKHFTEDPVGDTGHSTMASAFGAGDAASVDSKDSSAGLISAVWSSCQRYMTDEVTMWQGLMSRVYEAEANAGVGLEWGVDALQSIMQKAKP